MSVKKFRSSSSSPSYGASPKSSPGRLYTDPPPLSISSKALPYSDVYKRQGRLIQIYIVIPMSEFGQKLLN